MTIYFNLKLPFVFADWLAGHLTEHFAILGTRNQENVKFNSTERRSSRLQNCQMLGRACRLVFSLGQDLFVASSGKLLK